MKAADYSPSPISPTARLLAWAGTSVLWSPGGLKTMVRAGSSLQTFLEAANTILNRFVLKRRGGGYTGR